MNAISCYQIMQALCGFLLLSCVCHRCDSCQQLKSQQLTSSVCQRWTIAQLQTASECTPSQHTSLHHQIIQAEPGPRQPNHHLTTQPPISTIQLAPHNSALQARSAINGVHLRYCASPRHQLALVQVNSPSAHPTNTPTNHSRLPSTSTLRQHVR